MYIQINSIQLSLTCKCFYRGKLIGNDCAFHNEHRFLMPRAHKIEGKTSTFTLSSSLREDIANEHSSKHTFNN